MSDEMTDAELYERFEPSEKLKAMTKAALRETNHDRARAAALLAANKDYQDLVTHELAMHFATESIVDGLVKGKIEDLGDGKYRNVKDAPRPTK